MAKYRITSIPQAKKGKIVKSEETPNSPMVEVQGVQQPSYWNESLPGYMRGEGCPPGSYMFNGQCLPESEYIAASKAEMQKEQEDFDAKSLARKIAFVKDINDIRTKANEEHNRWVADDSAKYLDAFAKSKKQDKIEPYVRESESKYSPETLEELKKNFLVHKKDGFVELYPLNLVKDRIITNGFQAEQFKNYWGLDPKQVKEQLGDLMGAAKANYEAEVTKSILTKAIEQGKPVDKVIKELSPKIGTQSGLKSTFEKPANKIIDDAYASLVSSMDAIPGTDRAKVEQDRKIFLESDDPMDAWERRYHSGTNNLGDFINYQSQKTERGEKAYSDWMDKYGKAGQYDGLTFAKDDAMANVRQNNALLNQTLNQKNALAAANTAKAKDFNDAYAAYLGNFQSDAAKQVLKQALDKAGSNAQGKLEILKSFQEDPNQAMQKLLQEKTGNKDETYADVLNSSVDAMLMRELNPDTIKQGTDINENTTGSKIRDVLANPFDAAYFAMNPREEMWGNSNQSYETRKDIAKKFGVDTGLMPKDNPLAIVRDYTMLQAANPFKIGTNLRKGYDKGEFLNALGDELIDIGTKRGMMKGTNALLSGQGFKQGLQAFNNPLFTAGFMAKTPENISNAYNNFQQGNYGTAALDALEGYWGAAPLIRGIKPAVGTLQTLNSLRTPGTVAFGNIPSRFTGVYNAATPGSGLVLGNPNITGAKPIYESITNPLNKVSKRLGLGEFSILEQNPKGYLGTGSYPLLGYSDGGLIKARTGLPVVAESLSGVIKPSSKIITPIVNTLPGFTERRNIIQGLKELGYVGPQTMGADMLKAAKSDESLKKFMQSAIDYDRTGFRQVSGQFHPIGNRLDNYGNHGQYNMYEVSGENPLSEYENMITRGVDMDNPLSLGAYQATSIPMDQYGYRAGLPDMPRMDGLYLAPTPNTEQYGRYQFKVKQDMDLDSGNWQDLFDQYIIGKNRIYNQDGRVRHNLDPNKVYFADPGGKGIEGSGIDMRIWTGGKGKQVGIIDPTFKFTDLKNMSAEDYLDMDTYKKSLLNRWNTGFRGDYKKGGMVAKLSKKEIDQYIKDGYIIEDE